LVGRIDADRKLPNLSSAIRVFVLDYYRNRRPTSDIGGAPTSTAGKPKVGAPSPKLIGDREGGLSQS
jgi:predicted DNA-binding ribbon-helix-helix protein